MTQLLIEQGYGKNTGDTISLRGPPHPRLEEVLLSFSCYPPALPKIRTCLAHSRRYDCVVQSGWFRAQAGGLEQKLKDIGIELQVLALCEDGYTPNLRGFNGVRP